MATPKWLDYMTGDVQATGIPYDITMRMLSALAAIASGQNPDGTTSPSGETGSAIQAANVLDGRLALVVTTGAAAIVTVPAGRTWVGSLSITASIAENGADTVQASTIAILAVAGAGVTPPAGTVLSCSAYAGANVAAGTTGNAGNNNVTAPQVVVIAPAGNSVTINASTTITGDAGRCDFSAFGLLQ
jgi:hypothetical protein